jgi:hypothetical protein
VRERADERVIHYYIKEKRKRKKRGGRGVREEEGNKIK